MSLYISEEAMTQMPPGYAHGVVLKAVVPKLWYAYH